MTADEKIYECAGMSIEHGMAWDAYVENVGEEYASKEEFEDSYGGEWDSEVDFATEMFEDCYRHEIPEHLRAYIDYELFSRDLFLGGDYYSVESDMGVFVFRNC